MRYLAAGTAVVFSEPKKVEMREFPMQEPLAGEVLVKTLKTLISTGTETTVLSGEFPKGSAWTAYAKYPFLPGYCNIGRVLQVGPGVDESLVGKKVSSCGRHSQYILWQANEIKVIDRDIEDEQAVFATIFSIVANGLRRSEVSFSESAVVYGLGLLGQFAARLLALAGARPIVAVDVAAERLTLLPRENAIHPVNPQNEDVEQKVLKLTRGRKADLVFEVTGNQRLIPEEFKPLRSGGRFIVLSSPRGKVEFDFHDLCNAPSFKIIGAHTQSHPKVEEMRDPWTMLRHWEYFFDLLADGQICVGPLISHRAKYSQAPALYQMLLEDRSKAMGVVLDWN